MNDDLRAAGFASDKEWQHMVASVDLTQPAVVTAFVNWREHDGTKPGLQTVLDMPPVALLHDHFLTSGPTAISFSGGRTSAYMLWRVIQAHGGKLPAHVIVCFANTGKEREETLAFVRDCAQHWNVEIIWVEYRDNEQGFERVTFETASRDGEPFEALIRKRRYLPNPVTRFCTSELKIRTMHKHLRSLGWHDTEDGWDQLIGIRADEQRRVVKIRARGTSTESAKETMCMPLADAGITKRDVGAFWKAQPFDLGLPNVNGVTPWGNCDLCYLKGPRQVFSMIRQEPQRAIWWARQEEWASENIEGVAKGDGWRFRNDRPGYRRMFDYATAQGELFPFTDADAADDEAIACFCGD